jgi:hypothetical protein
MSIRENSLSVQSDIAEWPCWTDEHVWTLTAPDESSPIPHGRETVTIAKLSDYFEGTDPSVFSDNVYVEWKIGETLQLFRAFETIEQARAFAASIWGDGDCAEGESTLYETTLSGIEHWTAHLEPGPDMAEQGDSGEWYLPVFNQPMD